ncbi:MAG: iron-sulfur cluster assembly scaffold protein [Candidatus Rokubacteria bacterium]|nr:iron-sulfur cluster assembly scaffold protein [Candidatus Rokubacteria bacterium]
MTAPLYGGLILERFRHPRHFGELPGADAVHEDVNPLCGDRLRIELRLGADQDVEAVRFQGDACAIATASADLLAEMVEGRPVTDALRLERDQLLAALGAPIRASRLGCVSLPLAVLRGALGAGADRIAAVRGRDAASAPPGPSGVPKERR